MPKPKVYVTRELPERGLKIIKQYFDTEVWTEYAPPPKKVIIEKAKNVDALAPLFPAYSVFLPRQLHLELGDLPHET